jgi:2-succinyl-5-enolpyruvyl-6-hydroxy-3-cyclohexene-1-carboxylate synthase
MSNLNSWENKTLLELITTVDPQLVGDRSSERYGEGTITEEDIVLAFPQTLQGLANQAMIRLGLMTVEEFDLLADNC